MKKFIVSLFLLGWVPLYANASPIPETGTPVKVQPQAAADGPDRSAVHMQKTK